jgi:hypothetical protein
MSAGTGPRALSDGAVIWEIRNPDGASMGLEFARARLDGYATLLVHAAPSRIEVVVRDAAGAQLASAEDLEAEGATPMSRLTVREGSIRRENVWPDDSDVGLPVILPGGEVGILISWWNAEDHSSWRWQIELSNSV